MNRQLISRLLCALAAGALLGVAGCTNNNAVSNNATSVLIGGAGLPATTSAFYYELWVSAPKSLYKTNATTHGNAQYISVGKFRVDSTGARLGLTGGTPAFIVPSSVNASLLEDAILTLQLTSTPDTAPGPRLLSGSFSGSTNQGVAHLTLGGDDAFGSALDSTASGTFLLNAPTSAVTGDSEGVWFATKNGNTFTGSLNLPALPVSDGNPDWRYESFLTVNSGNTILQAISMGRFARPDSADDNGPGQGAGTVLSAAYNTPGEDFLNGGTSGSIFNGGHGVIVALQPVGFPISQPFMPLLSATIEPTAGRLKPVTLTLYGLHPYLDITVNR